MWSSNRPLITRQHSKNSKHVSHQILYYESQTLLPLSFPQMPFLVISLTYPVLLVGPLATLHHGRNPMTHVRACDPTSHVPNTPFLWFPCPSPCTIVPFSQPSPSTSHVIVLTSTIACSLIVGPMDQHPPHRSAIVPIMYICTWAPAVWLPSLTSWIHWGSHSPSNPRSPSTHWTPWTLLTSPIHPLCT